MKFPPNTEVIYIGNDPNQDVKADNNPKYMESVIIEYFHSYYKAYVLRGYEYNKAGTRTQYFRECELAKPEEIEIEIDFKEHYELYA